MKIIAHRTTSGLYPPNSIQSLLFLVDHGVSAIEFDVCKSSNGKNVVAHPGLIERGMLDVSTPLKDFLGLCYSKCLDVFVDIKFTDLKFDRSFLRSVMETILEVGIGKQTVVISRSGKVLAQFKDTVATGCIMSEIKPESSCPWDLLLIPIITFQEYVDTLGNDTSRLVVTDVDKSNFEVTRGHNLFAMMTNNAIELQALMRERRAS